MAAKLSKTGKVAQFLRENQPKKFTAREIVEALLKQYPDDYQEKRRQFPTEEKFILQMCAEISWAHLSSVHNLLQCEKNLELKKKCLLV